MRIIRTKKGITLIINSSKLNSQPIYKRPIAETYNIKVAMWQIPYDKRYKDYDEDGSHWFEIVNKNGNNEIKKVEKELKISLNRYLTASKTTEYNDGTHDIETLFQNGNKIHETQGVNHVYIRIKDKFNKLVAEKIFGKDSNEGRKVIYKNIINGENTFTIVKIYSYDTTVNKKTDSVNFGYTSDFSTITKGCHFEKEYYMLNGKEVNAEKKDDSNYIVKTKDGKKLKFTVE